MEHCKGYMSIQHPSFRRFQHTLVECNLREVIRFAAKSRESVVAEKLDDRVMRLCQWGALRLLRNAYVDELKFDGSFFFVNPLTAIKAALGRCSSLSVGTLFLEKLPLSTSGVCRFLRDCKATFSWNTLQFHDSRPRNYTKVVFVVPCSTMMFQCPIDSAKYLTELLKRAKCSSLTIVHDLIKVKVVELIQAILSLHPSQIPQEFCMTMKGHYGGFNSGELHPCFDLLNMKMSAVSMTPGDCRGDCVHYRYLFPADTEGLVLEAIVGLRIRQPDVFVRRFQYRFLLGESSSRPRLSLRELPLHPLDYFKMGGTESGASKTEMYSIAFRYRSIDSCVRDVRVFNGLETTDDPLFMAKIHLAFAHFRNTYVREAFSDAQAAKFFCHYFAEDFNANVGTVQLSSQDQSDLAMRFSSVDLAILYGEATTGYILGLLPHKKLRRVENRVVANATFVTALIERFKQLDDTSKVLGSFTLNTEMFGVSEVFKRPADDVRVTEEPAFAPDAPTSSIATCICHRRRIRNVHTDDELEVCLIRPSKLCGVMNVNFRLVHSSSNELMSTLSECIAK